VTTRAIMEARHVARHEREVLCSSSVVRNEWHAKC